MSWQRYSIQSLIAHYPVIWPAAGILHIHVHVYINDMTAVCQTLEIGPESWPLTECIYYRGTVHVQVPVQSTSCCWGTMISITINQPSSPGTHWPLIAHHMRRWPSYHQEFCSSYHIRLMSLDVPQKPVLVILSSLARNLDHFAMREKKSLHM
jgi:gamma-glutamylcyclotransferase (GGCT)/AIG2-like uncharacterized protein YtfP